MRTRFRYVLFCSIGDFRNTLDGAGTPNTGLSPPAVLTGRPLCLRRLTARQGRFNARTETRRVYHYPDMRIMASSPPRLVVRSVAAPPIPPFFCGIMASLPSHGFPFGPHTKRIQWTYSILRAVASPQRPAGTVGLCRMATLSL